MHHPINLKTGTRNRILDVGEPHQVVDLRNDVELHQAVAALGNVFYGFELFTVVSAHVADVLEPVVDGAELWWN